MHGQNRTWDEGRLSASISRYDSSMKLVKELNLSEGGRMYSGAYWDFRKIGNKYWFICAAYERTRNSPTLTAIEVNPSTLETAPPKLLAAGSDIDLKLSFFNGITSWNIFCKTSPNGKHTSLCIFEGDNFFVCSLDENLDLEWKKRETEDISKVYIKSTEIDNAGNIYFAYVHDEEGHLIICTKEKKHLDKILHLKEGKPINIQLLSNKKGDAVTIAGTYQSDHDRITGVFKTQIGVGSSSIRTASIMPVPDSTVARFKEDGWRMSKKNDFLRLDIKLLQMDDENIVLTGEFREEREGSKAYRKFYLSGSILVAFLDEKQASFARVPKARISTVYLTGDSYFVHPYRNQLIIFYNDYPAHLKRDLSKSAEEANNYKNTALIAAVVNRTGPVQRQVVIDKSAEDYMSIPEDMQSPANNVVEVPLVKMGAVKGVDKDAMMIGKIVVAGEAGGLGKLSNN